MTISAETFPVPFRLGFGCSGAWAQSWHSRREAERVLLTAFEGGVRHFDTAGFYSRGEAERRLGVFLHEQRHSVFISSKTGTRYQFGRARKDFSPQAIRADVEASLKRLNRERIDLLYLHGPSGSEQASGLETLGRLKEEGKIGLAGVCGEGEGLRRAVSADGVDVVMGVYNIFRREHATVFDEAKRAGMGVVAIAPLAQGLYRQDFFTIGGAADVWRIGRALIRNRAELRVARAARPQLAAVSGWSAAQLVLAFALANSAIDVAMTTSTNAARLSESIAAARRTPGPEVMDLFNRLAT